MRKACVYLPHFFLKNPTLVIQGCAQVGEMEFTLLASARGGNRMNVGLRISKAHVMLLVLFIIALLAATLFVIHATMPSLWHTIAVSPFILNSQH
jgi:hypothetical protein